MICQLIHCCQNITIKLKEFIIKQVLFYPGQECTTSELIIIIKGLFNGRSVNLHLLGGLLLLLLLFLGVLLLLWWGLLHYGGWGRLLLLLLLDSHEETDDLLGLDHVVLIDLELAEDIVDLSLGHLVSPGHQGVLEHLGVNLAFHIVSLESLNNEVVRVVAVSGHFLLEHLDHVVVGAGASNFSQEFIKFRFSHEDTDVIEGSTEVILVNCPILVNVHHLEAVLVHLELLLGEALILSLAHGEVVKFSS